MNYLFLHGLGQPSSSWETTICNMDTKAEVLCPNLYDLLQDKEITYKNLYKSFSEYCSTFSEPLMICGLSLGGVLALQYAIEHPENVDSMVLVGTQFKMPKQLLKFQNAVFRLMPDRMFQQSGLGKHDFINLIKTMMHLDFQQYLEKITCPVLIVCGERDKANKKASAQLKAQIPNAEMVVIKQAGHEVNIDAPEKLGKLLNDFIEDRGTFGNSI